jgi:hypothetical protein
MKGNRATFFIVLRSFSDTWIFGFRYAQRQPTEPNGDTKLTQRTPVFCWVEKAQPQPTMDPGYAAINGISGITFLKRLIEFT